MAKGCKGNRGEKSMWQPPRNRKEEEGNGGRRPGMLIKEERSGGGPEVSVVAVTWKLAEGIIKHNIMKPMEESALLKKNHYGF